MSTVFSPLSVSGKIILHLSSCLETSTHVLSSLNNKTAGNTKFEISAIGLRTRPVENPARWAARTNKGGVSLLSTNGKPDVNESAE